MAVFEEAWRVVRDRFYDRGLHGVDWEGARQRHLAAARAARTQAELHEVINELVAELRSSHASIVEADVYRNHFDAEAKRLLAPMFGVKLARLEEGFFVADVVAGGPAAAAGLLRGDRVVAVGGRPPEEAGLRPMPYDGGLRGIRFYQLPTSRPGETLALELERFPQPKGRYEAALTSADWSELEACRQSARVVERWGMRLGVMRLYHLLSEDAVDMLEEALAGTFASCDGVVLDVRGQGGLPVAVDRVIGLFDPNGQGGPLWGRPAVALIDGETRSAKEILAYQWRRRGIGPLVGRRTRGAVLGALFHPLQDGAFLLVPVLDMRSATGGTVIEGRGVAPDVEVEDSLPWARGQDAILERGLWALMERVLAERRRGATHGWH